MATGIFFFAGRADGLQVGSPGKLTFPIVQEPVAGILLVSDDEMVETLCWMLERMKVLVEEDDR